MSHAKLRNLRNVAKTLEPDENTATKAVTPPKKKSKFNVRTPLSPCMASTDLTLSGLKGKDKRYTMRTELEVFVRRQRQRERIVSTIQHMKSSFKESVDKVTLHTLSPLSCIYCTHNTVTPCQCILQTDGENCCGCCHGRAECCGTQYNNADCFTRRT